MKTYKHLRTVLTDPARLAAAADAVVRGKRRRPDVAFWLLDREARLRDLAERLAGGTWRPVGFEVLWVYDPKARAIARAPVGDRVVHRLLVDAFEPCWQARLAPEDFACRPGFGTHRAVLALQGAMQRHRHALHLDVRAYFPSIEWARLRALVAARVADPFALDLLDRVLLAGEFIYRDPGVRAGLGLEAAWPPPDGRHGLPVGAATSQFLATHVFLNAFDHWIKRSLRVPAYVRYVDDVFVFGDSAREMELWRREIATWLRVERGLRLKHPDAPVLSCLGAMDALGHRIRRDARAPLPRTVRRMRHALARAATVNDPLAAAEKARRIVAGYAGTVLF